MTKTFTLKGALLVTAALMLPVAHAAAMSKDEYKAAKDRVSETYKADKKACDAMSANAKDVCQKEAKGREKVGMAELEANYTGKPRDQEKLAKARAEAAYDVAKEKCDDKAGNDKDVCVTEAKATRTKALADIKAGHETRGARSEAADDKRDADYKVAKEKCDAMAGDAKDQCLAQAKAKHGKS